MHSSTVFYIMQSMDMNILNLLPSEDYFHLRKFIIELILSTDMAKHFSFLGFFRTRAITLNDINMENDEDRLIVLSMGIKCADLGHTAKILPSHRRWTNLIVEELFS